MFYASVVPGRCFMFVLPAPLQDVGNFSKQVDSVERVSDDFSHNPCKEEQERSHGVVNLSYERYDN